MTRKPFVYSAVFCTVIDEPQLADQQHLSRVKIESSVTSKGGNCGGPLVGAKSELAPTIYSSLHKIKTTCFHKIVLHCFAYIVIWCLLCNMKSIQTFKHTLELYISSLCYKDIRSLYYFAMHSRVLQRHSFPVLLCDAQKSVT